MATKRKQRAVSPSEIPSKGNGAGADAPPAPAPSMAAPTPEALPTPPPVSADTGILQRLTEQKLAEQIQREAALAQAQQPTLDQRIDALPLSDHKKKFLKAYPGLMDPSNAAALTRHYQAALADGVVDDSEAMNQRILDGFARDLRAAQAQVPDIEKIPPASTLPPSSPPMARAMAEFEEIAPPTPRPAPPARSRVPISAPVSRQVPTSTGDRSGGQVTLSRDEIEVAHLSYANMPKPEAERLYAQMKLKRDRMRATGEYPGPERN